MKKISLIIIPVFLFLGCKPKLDNDVSFNAGNADFSKTIFVGDGLLSGYTNGGLYAEGQSNSIAKILSTQLQVVGGDAISQPIMAGVTGSGHLEITSFTNNTIEVNMLDADAQSGSTIMSVYCYTDSILPNYSPYSGTITNFATPNFKVGDLLDEGIGSPNAISYSPYYGRISTGSSYYSQIGAQAPTFFVVAFGLSDVLHYAENGADCGNTTSKNVFEENYDSLVSLLVSKTDQGVLCEIPRLEKLPYLNANYSASGDLYVRAKRHINEGYETRKYTTGDQFLRSNFDKIGVDGYGLSDTLPIRSADVLDKEEINDIASDIFNYNQIIHSIAEKHNLPVVSLENYLISESGTFLGDSVVFNGTNTKITYAPGSAVSLDGIFPAPRGAAAIANQFIVAINDFYEARVPLVDINKYEGLKLP